MRKQPVSPIAGRTQRGTVNRKGLADMSDFTRGMVFALALIGLEMCILGVAAGLPIVFIALLAALMHDGLTRPPH